MEKVVRKIGAIARISEVNVRFREHPITRVKTRCIALTLDNQVKNSELFLRKLDRRLKSHSMKSRVELFAPGNNTATHLSTVDGDDHIHVLQPVKRSGAAGQEICVFSGKFITMTTSNQEAFISKLKTALRITS